MHRDEIRCCQIIRLQLTIITWLNCVNRDIHCQNALFAWSGRSLIYSQWLSSNERQVVCEWALSISRSFFFLFFNKVSHHYILKLIAVEAGEKCVQILVKITLAIKIRSEVTARRSKISAWLCLTILSTRKPTNGHFSIVGTGSNRSVASSR